LAAGLGFIVLREHAVVVGEVELRTFKRGSGVVDEHRPGAGVVKRGLRMVLGA
jgi:hypothetical protein